MNRDEDGTFAIAQVVAVGVAAVIMAGVAVSAATKAISGAISMANKLINDIDAFIANLKSQTKARTKTKTAVKTKSAIQTLSKSPNKPCAPASNKTGTVIPIADPFSIEEAQQYIKRNIRLPRDVVCVDRTSAAAVVSTSDDSYHDEAHRNTPGYFPHYHDGKNFNHAHIWYYITP